MLQSFNANFNLWGTLEPRNRRLARLRSEKLLVLSFLALQQRALTAEIGRLREKLALSRTEPEAQSLRRSLATALLREERLITIAGILDQQLELIIGPLRRSVNAELLIFQRNKETTELLQQRVNTLALTKLAASEEEEKARKKAENSLDIIQEIKRLWLGLMLFLQDPRVWFRRNSSWVLKVVGVASGVLTLVFNPMLPLHLIG
jgi:hypothetical protein